MLVACGSAKHGPSAVDQARRAVAKKCPDQSSSSCTVFADIPSWVEDEQLPARAIPGAVLFAQSGCMNCHTYLGDGMLNIGGADLSQIGRQLEERQIVRVVREGSDPMPAFAGLGPRRIGQIAVFLAASR